ncbi:MAG: AI-2E family transporter [Rhodothermales bacterium]|nr:AI-2E family transporter [Rhodothermales bacterium]
MDELVNIDDQDVKVFGGVTASKLMLVLLFIVVVFVVGVILNELRTVLLPFAIALLLSNIFKPIVTYLKGKRVPTVIALFVVLLSFAVLLFLLSLILYSSIETFTQELPKYQGRVTRSIQSLNLSIQELAARFDVTLEGFWWRNAIQLSSITSAITSGIGSFITLASYTFLIILFMLFILAESGQFSSRVRKAFPSDQATHIAAILGNIDDQVRQYLLTKSMISAGTGVLTSLILWALGVDFALLWGFLAFLLNFIPNIGSVISTLLPFFLSLLQFETLTIPVLVLVLLGIVQISMGNVVEPNVMAFSLNLSALVILISLIFWGWLWGIWGMILAVPFTATLKIVFENIEPLRPISVLMSGAET